MKHILLSLLLLLAVCGSAYASKAVSRKIEVTLTDGSHRTVRLIGDEHFSCYASTQGELIMREGTAWRLATETEQAAAKTRLSRAKALRANEKITATRPFPHVGNPKALVIMVDFTDQKFTYEKDVFNSLFNSSDYDDTSGYHSYSSLAQYMNDCSNGQYRPEFDVVGPYSLSNTVAYYGKNKNNKDSNYAEMITEACSLADQDVDFSDYDADNDGYVDLVYIVYAGYGENWGGSDDYLWPKSGVGSFGTFDGVKVYRYGINQELAAYEGKTGSDGKPLLNGIGVLCHEFCHTLGLCDVYPTASWEDITSYDNQSMELWDLMDYGENNYNGYYPTPLNAWQRELLGWITIDTLSDPADVVLEPVDYGGKAYRIANDNDATGNEYYILESIPNGQGTGWYRRMPGNGMLVTHVNYSASAFSNFSSPNNVKGAPRFTILPADGILMTSYRMGGSVSDELSITNKEYSADHAGDTYPGTGSVTALTDYKAYTGTVDKPITDITQDGWKVSFKFMGGTYVDGIGGVSVAAEHADGATYNLAGQRVGSGYRGITIRNGKKTMQYGKE